MNYSGIFEKYLVVINCNKSNIILLCGVILLSCENSIYNNYDANPEDWVEIYNASNDSISLGLWKLKDEKDDHIFIIPDNQVLEAGQYLVLCKDSLAFNDNFPNISNFIGGFDFGFNASGESIRLFDLNENLVDAVVYDDADPWPTEPDGSGHTLELIHPSLDNDSGVNWAASNTIGGTPGAINSIYTEENSTGVLSGIVINEINYNSADE